MSTPLPITVMKQTRVLVVGDIMLDEYWFSAVERISPEAPVPIALVQKKTLRPGGAANVACNIAALGGQVTLLGMVGKDAHADQLSALLAQRGIRSAMVALSNYETTVKLRVLAKNQQLIRVDFEKKLLPTQLSDLDAAFERLISEHDVVVFSDYAKGSLHHVQRYIQTATSKGVRTLVDPKGADYSAYHGAHLITPNKSEFKLVAGAWDSEAGLTDLAHTCVQQWGIDALLITRSEEGMSLYTPSDTIHQASLAQEVFDVSGAGDSVIATLALLIGAGLTLPDAMTWANAAAGVVVKKIGTDVCTLDELLAANPQLHTVRSLDI
jgi:D-glycero-beta-D-manno-heptose-7-phosphate kinase